MAKKKINRTFAIDVCTAKSIIKHMKTLTAAQMKTLNTTLATLRAELAACTTRAMRACVQRRIDAVYGEAYGEGPDLSTDDETAWEY